MKLEKPHYLPGEKLEDGSLYVGIMSNGADMYHLSIEPNDEPNELTWYEAIKLLGCPNLREMKLISANAKALGLGMRGSVYWSSTEGNKFYAYYERFSDGFQASADKNNGFLVRCVRRYSIIQPFDYLRVELADLKAKIAEIEEKLK